MARLRWGILGAARIAREWVAPAIHLSDRGELAAVASLTPGKAEDLAAPYGARVLRDYPAMLADPGIDAIYIPLPTPSMWPGRRGASKPASMCSARSRSRSGPRRSTA